MKKKRFRPIDWCTDMAGSNLSALRKVFGEDVVHRIKTCEFHSTVLMKGTKKKRTG